MINPYQQLVVFCPPVVCNGWGRVGSESTVWTHTRLRKAEAHLLPIYSHTMVVEVDIHITACSDRKSGSI